MRTVLCIDDDRVGVSIRAKLLERFDYRVLTANSATEGLDLIAREPADIIVLDYDMPDMTGAQVAWELRRRRCPAPILLLSAEVFCPAEASDVVDAFCTKLDGPKHLLATMERLVASAELRPMRFQQA